jgi:hypothetical protein
MLNLIQIRNSLRLGSCDRLIERILRNGRCPHPSARTVLCAADSARPAALGLALQRWCELTWDVNETAATIAGKLLAIQRPDGLFGDGPTGSIASAAVAVRGLLDWGERYESGGRGIPSELHTAAHRALHAIAASQDHTGLLGGDPIASSIGLWQLGDQALARRKLNMPALLAAVNAASTSDSDLCRFAYAVAA